MTESLEPSRSRLEVLGSGDLDYLAIGITRLISRSIARSYCDKDIGRLDRAHFIGAYEALETVSHGKRVFIRCRRVGPLGLTQLVLVELVSFDPWLYLREELDEETRGWRLVAEPGYMPSLLHVNIRGVVRSYKMGYGNLLPLSKMGMSKLLDRSATRAVSVLEDNGYVVAGYATHRLGLVENLILVADKEDLSESIRILITSHYSNIYWFSRTGATSIRSTETKPEKLARELRRLITSKETSLQDVGQPGVSGNGEPGYMGLEIEPTL